MGEIYDRIFSSFSSLFLLTTPRPNGLADFHAQYLKRRITQTTISFEASIFYIKFNGLKYRESLFTINANFRAKSVTNLTS